MNYQKWTFSLTILLLVLVWSGQNALYAQKVAPGEIAGAKDRDVKKLIKN